MDPVILSPGYGFRVPSREEMLDRVNALGLLAVFERPRRRGTRRYVIGADVADGLGFAGDRSVAQVIRVQTLDEPAEQVAEYAADDIEPGPFAYILQALGRYYTDEDGTEALIAVERTHHGLSTIDTLHLHLGYTRQYVWEYYNAKDPTQRFSQSLGWSTTPITRPILIDKFITATKTFDVVTGLPDLIVNSKPLLDEMQDFQTEGALWEAAAARGAKDDRILSLMIAYNVAWRTYAGELEPIDERRRRRNEQQAMLKDLAGQPARLDWRNTPATADELKSGDWQSHEHGLHADDKDEESLAQQLNSLDYRNSDASALGHDADEDFFGFG